MRTARACGHTHADRELEEAPGSSMRRRATRRTASASNNCSRSHESGAHKQRRKLRGHGDDRDGENRRGAIKRERANSDTDDKRTHARKENGEGKPADHDADDSDRSSKSDSGAGERNATSSNAEPSVASVNAECPGADAATTCAHEAAEGLVGNGRGDSEHADTESGGDKGKGKHQGKHEVETQDTSKIASEGQANANGGAGSGAEASAVRSGGHDVSTRSGASAGVGTSAGEYVGTIAGTGSATGADIAAKPDATIKTDTNAAGTDTATDARDIGGHGKHQSSRGPESRTGASSNAADSNSGESENDSDDDSDGDSDSDSDNDSDDGSDDDSDDSDDDSDDEDEEDDTKHKFHQPITDSRTVTFRVRDLNQHLVCALCHGYYRDAHTVIECLHAFCKSCLLKNFVEQKQNRSKTRQEGTVCPLCNARLAANPRNSIRADRTLQELVDKIFPQLSQQDEQAEEQFYASRGIQLRSELRVRDEQVAQEQAQPRKKQRVRAPDASVEDDISFKLSPEAAGADTPEDMVLGALDKPFLRTSGKLKVIHLKKYLVRKLQLASVAEVEVLCKGETLGQELSLLFISRSRWVDQEQDLILNYRSCKEGSSLFDSAPA